MNIRALILSLLLLSTTVFGQEWKAGFDGWSPDFSGLTEDNHPRLFITDEDMKGIAGVVADNTNPYLTAMHRQMMTVAEKAVASSANVRWDRDEHRNPLQPIRKALSAIVAECYGYRYTSDKRFLKHAEKDLNALCDSAVAWNCPEFLQRGELALTLAIGYDWLHADLKSKTKKHIVDVLMSEAFVPAVKPVRAGYHYSKHNWNSVCIGGLTTAAIAVYEKIDTVGLRVVQDAYRFNPNGMHAYYPDGASYEGPSYWNYGTMYQSILLMALEDNLGTDFGLSQAEGFLKSGLFRTFSVGNLNMFFDYADCREKNIPSTPLWYLAYKTCNHGLLYNEIKTYLSGKGNGYEGDRSLFLALACAYRMGHFKAEPFSGRVFTAKGIAEQAIVRTGWGRKDSYLGIKGGCARANHAHMDAGSFVFETGGVRWACDALKIDYGMNAKYFKPNGKALFDSKQNSWRWHLFGSGITSHNVLIINDRLFDVEACATLQKVYDEESCLGASFDLTTLYGGMVKSAVRTALICDDSYLEVTDRIVTGEEDVKVRWNFVTKATVTLESDGSIILTQSGQKMRLSTDAPESMCMIWSGDPKDYDTPVKDFDKKIKGVTICGFEFSIPRGEVYEIKTTLKPCLNEVQ